MDDTQAQVQTPRPLTKKRVEQARARVAAIWDELRKQGIEPTDLADPVEMLVQERNAAPGASTE